MLNIIIPKWINTVAPTILMGVTVYNPVVLVSSIFCSVLDLIHLALLVRHKKHL